MTNDFAPKPVKEQVSFDDFDKIDIRVGEIIAIEEIAKSHSVVKLIVDFGDHQRSILAGIKKERSNLDQLVNTKTLFLLNIAPREMLGEESQGMLFDIGYGDDQPPALALLEHDLPNGVRAG